MENNKNSADISNSEKSLTFSLLNETLKDFYKISGIIPDIIYLNINQYLDFPNLFIPGQDMGNYHNGFIFSGIKILLK